MPTMAGAFTYDLAKNYNLMTADNLTLVAVGFITAFVAALIVVRTLLDYVSSKGFQLFAWWRVLVGTLGLIALALGY
jgi:undecaprenyl-diphosphatase